VAAAGEAQALAHGFAEDGAAGVEDPLDHGGVLVGHVAVEQDGAVAHGHAGHGHIVLDRDGPAGERAATV
jgi:hypothetical protein